MGLILFAGARYTDALQHFNKALEMQGIQAQIRHNRALCLLKLKAFDEARREIEVIERLEVDGKRIYSEHLKKLLSRLDPMHPMAGGEHQS